MDNENQKICGGGTNCLARSLLQALHFTSYSERYLFILRGFQKFGIRTQARRISNVKLDDPDGIEVPRVEFQDEQGKVIRVTLDWNLNTSRNEFISVIYDPANPQRVIPGSWIKYINLIFGVVLLLFSIAIIMNFENDNVMESSP
jgi:hypothetical protein